VGRPTAGRRFTNIADTQGVLHGRALCFCDMLQSPDDPADLLLVLDWGQWFGQWNSSMPEDKFLGGLVRSRDGGASWAHVAAQPPGGFVGDSYADFGQLALDGGDADARWWGIPLTGVSLSRDRGETWAVPAGSAATFWPWGFYAVAPDTSPATGVRGCVYVLATTGAKTSPKPGSALQHTCDFGETFATVPGSNFSLPADTAGYPAPFIAAHRTGALAVAAVLGDDAVPHVWVSLDASASWAAVDRAEAGQYYGCCVTGLAFDALDPSVLYVSTGGRSLVTVKLSAASSDRTAPVE